MQFQNAGHKPDGSTGPSVRNGPAGSPALFTRFGWSNSPQPNRTIVGFATSGLDTTTVCPRISAFAGTNFLSLPAMVKQVSAAPSLVVNPSA